MTSEVLRLLAAARMHDWTETVDVAGIRLLELERGEWPTFVPNAGVNIARHRLRYRMRLALLVRARLRGDDTPAFIILYDYPPTIEGARP